MANTEGLPDEVLPSLLSPSPYRHPTSTTDPTPASTSSSRGNRSRRDRLARRDAALRARSFAVRGHRGAGDGGGNDNGKAPAEPSTVETEEEGPVNTSSVESRSMPHHGRTTMSPPKFPRSSLRDRTRMEEMGPGVSPAATVIRPSSSSASRNPPTVVRSSAAAGGNARRPSPSSSGEQVGDGSDLDNSENGGGNGSDLDVKLNRPSGLDKGTRPVLLSNSIVERPWRVNGVGDAHDVHDDRDGDSSSTRRPPSRFRRRQRKEEGAVDDGGGDRSGLLLGRPPTKGGFPSLDVPVGTFARRRHTRGMARPTVPPPLPPPPSSGGARPVAAGNASSSSNFSPLIPSGEVSAIDANGTADAMLAGMSLKQIREGVEEVESALSAEVVDFLRRRGREKQQGRCRENDKEGIKLEESSSGGADASEDASANAEEGASATEDKERTAEVLSSIRSLEELEEAYEEARRKGAAGCVPLSTIVPEGASSDRRDALGNAARGLVELGTASSLLRSTSPHQRLLGAKTVCEIVEAEVAKMRHSASHQTARTGASSYPPLLPVALRCLLDLPSPQGHGVILSYALRSLHALAFLFVHPHHRVCIDPDETDERLNPATIYQIHYLDDDVPTPSSGSCYSTGTTVVSVDSESRKDNPDGASSTGAAFYATNSSADTAASDASAFYADPSWTLLSRMRILPRLSNILRSAADRNKARGGSIGTQLGATVFSKEGLRAACGILALLAVRSPGAACAIGGHRDALPSVVTLALTLGGGDASSARGGDVAACGDETLDGGGTKETPGTTSGGSANKTNGPAPERGGTGEFVVDTVVALPALILLCTLVRQSRTVASLQEPFETVVPNLQAILGMSAECQAEWTVQRWCIIFFRTLLRYGLALPHLSTLVSLAVPHLTVSRPLKYNLAAEYLTAFANVCDCAKLLTCPSSHASHSELLNTLTFAQKESLSMAGIWLSSSAQKCATFLQYICLGDRSSTTDTNVTKEDSLSPPSKIKLASARLRFLASYTAAAAPAELLERSGSEMQNHHDNHQKSNDPSMEGLFVPVVSRKSCILALKALLDCGNIQSMLDKVLQHAFIVEWTEPLLSLDVIENEVSLLSEASACAFLKAYFMLLSSCLNWREEKNVSEGEDTSALLSSLTEQLCGTTAKSLRTQKLCSPASDLCNGYISSSAIHIARSGWLNAAHFSVCRFLSSMKSGLGGLDCLAEDTPLQPFVFSLIGRLLRGDESKLAILLSQDVFFQPHAEKDDGTGDAGSPLQNMLLKELCRTKHAQLQLDHSFKLMKGLGITAEGIGTFSIQSLRSDVDFITPTSNHDVDLLVPLGGLWIWNILSSTICPPADRAADSVEENREQNVLMLDSARSIVYSCLRLLLSIEETFGSFYASRVANGAKLYHLMNACLYPGEVIGDERVENLIVALFNKYAYGDNHVSSDASEDPRLEGEEASLSRFFIRACFHHSCTMQGKRQDEADNKQVLRAKSDHQIDTQQVADFFNRNSLINMQSRGPSRNEMLAVRDFVSDMCTAYIEYGAQYDAFTCCMRFFLRPGFPPEIRSDVVLKLRDLLHLFTLRDEKRQPSGQAMFRSLEWGVSGGLPSRDGTSRDSGEFLDALALVLKRDRTDDSHFRLDATTGDFVYLLAVAYLARNLASSSQRCECGLEAMRRRMTGLNAKTLEMLVAVARHLLCSKDGSRKDLVESVLKVCVRKEFAPCHDLDDWACCGDDDATWLKMVDLLQCKRSRLS